MENLAVVVSWTSDGDGVAPVVVEAFQRLMQTTSEVQHLEVILVTQTMTDENHHVAALYLEERNETVTEAVADVQELIDLSATGDHGLKKLS